ncbi:MAG: mechanosensitive ion channel family protein [Pseudomonadota bacterium]
MAYRSVAAYFVVLSLCIFTALSGQVLSQQTGEEPATEAPSSAMNERLTERDVDLRVLALGIIPLTAAELSALGEAWFGVARRETEQISEIQMRLLSATGEQASQLRSTLSELTNRRQDAFAKLDAVIDNLEAKGGDAEQIASYRAYKASILTQEVQQGDFVNLANRVMGWLMSPDGGLAFLIRIAVIVGAFFGLLIAARIVRGYFRRVIGRIPNLSKLLQSFLLVVVYWITIAIGLMIVLSALGVDITPLFALIGGASFIIAFAMQDTLSNLAAGLMIMINRPFDEGDFVGVAGTSGTVNSVSIVSTTVVTPDNKVIVIPNSKVWGDIITNSSASETRRVDLIFGIGYGDSIEQAHAVLAKVVGDHPMVLADPATNIQVSELADSSVNFIVRPWVMTEDYWTVYWDLMRDVKLAFDEAGISIPFPQTDMHVKIEDTSIPGLGNAAKPPPANVTEKNG